MARLKIDDPGVVETIKALLGDKLAEFDYSNYGVNAAYTPYSGGFKVTHRDSGISISCHSERSLLDNVEKVCNAAMLLIENL